MPRKIDPDSTPGFTTVSNRNLELFFLNETASFFLDNIGENNTIENIFNEYIETYDVDKNHLMRDFCLLVRDLQWKNIIQVKRVAPRL